MKNKIFILLLCILVMGCTPNWGDDDNIAQPVTNYEPVILNRSQFEDSITYETMPRSIEKSGKIYVKGDYIFVNEVNKGFHIIDNSDPTNPNNVGFIKVLGSSDLSIKSNVFYANNATDLIAFKINENNQSVIINKRLNNVFPQIRSPEGFSYYGLQNDEIIIDWVLTDDNE